MFIEAVILTGALMALSLGGSDPGDLPVVGSNLLANGSFEAGEGGQPLHWAPHTWAGDGRFVHAEDGRGGGRCLMIESDTGGDLSWETFAPVRPHRTYLLSAWIRTDNLAPGSGTGALLNVHGYSSGRTAAVIGTADWTRVQALVRSGNREQLHVNCLFGGWGRSTGRAWFDDVRLEELSLEDLQLTATIDATATSEPISRYIYGQFIEHLGRCIYRGLWSEMLEDRKFFYPVTERSSAPAALPRAEPEEVWPRDMTASPWRIIGPDDAVAMEVDEAFTPRPIPHIRLSDGGPAGIEQAGLAVIEGRTYAGRILLAGGLHAAPVQVSLHWGDADDACDTVTIDAVGPEYETIPLRFTARASAADARLRIIGLGRGELRIAAVSLMPADNIHGFRRDTIALLRELDAPIYRWPGGNFVSGYDWRDGIGDPDRRPTYRNPAWAGLETNDVGLDEFITLCRLIDAEPLIVVNTGFGDAYSAAQEVEYANGDASTPMGRLRAANGHPEPYRVTWWGIGNEMYGSWQLGYIQLGQYVLKHNQVVDRMRAVVPGIRTIAVGAVGDWSRTMLTRCADHMDLISEHFYCGERQDVPEHIAQIRSAVRAKAEAHRLYRRTIPSLAGRDIRIALDEWNYWYGPHIYGELGTRYHLKDALGIAAGLHEFFRNSDIFHMAAYAQTVNVIGAIKTTKTNAAFAATGLVLKLYRREFGEIPVALTGNCDLLDVDIAAAWTADRRTLTVAAINPHAEAQEVELNVAGAALNGEARLFIIAGNDPMLYNEPGTPEAPDAGERIRIREVALTDFRGPLSLAPHSITLYRFEAAPTR
jgi:alpha-N-arabinofuranosidase